MNYIGQKFGKLLILDKIKTYNGKQRAMFKCRCDCGKIRLIRDDSVLRGHSLSCGCSKYQHSFNNRNWKGYGEISATHWLKIKHGAERRNIEFKITIEEIWNLFLKQNRKCALSGTDLQFSTTIKKYNGTASLDRIDSSKGYTTDNIQWVHKDINNMKQYYSQEEFLNWCQKIVAYFQQ